MKKLTCFTMALLLTQPVAAQTFQDFLTRVNAAPAAQHEALIDSFLAVHPVLPLREDTLAHFLYRGTASRVTVPGDANGWNPDAFPMTRLAATTLWYFSRVFERDARLDYKFVINNTTWLLDPRNPYRVSGGFGPNSELRMPAYVPPPEIQYDPAIPHGSLHDTTFFSVALNHSRVIRVYTPPDYAATSAHYPVVLFHDGLEYLTLAQANNVIDYLIAHNRIVPILAVFVPPNPARRAEEYAGSLQEQFTAFIVKEVMPWVDRRYRTRREAGSRATLGASNGGNIALWLGCQHPEVFGNIAAHSSNVENNVRAAFENSPRLDLKLYLDMGTYDLNILIARVGNFLPVLQAKGYTYKYLEFHEGHSWGNWRAHIDNALEMFFPGGALAVAGAGNKPADFALQQNYPNPFNPGTTINYHLSRPARVELAIYNLQGGLVQRLVDSLQAAGGHSISWTGLDQNGSALASGVYLYRLQIDGKTAAVRRMLLLR
ncbi:MAG: alpha/beta hydrolase-fold protein [candidate division KSB1 bacterium]|nr:alpha/beta hydrolase-fold protein [candidate division KSB1 bacterium]MDZ7288291.1 alpha/beta hydrolase-fold protein [candidate division KSB1 bacterium]MDZ7300485.1 alpha/beta hydrolase-fold protein [candidate division KSB1 bacterium]MDZ7351483.1 alpha/beta hydrolase-fold protein [candidate division KSB1 bacterium]MDZ7355843.1 alpha/beta hydrolase-fold protein [candidate division KSB1 bacterium]